MHLDKGVLLGSDAFAGCAIVVGAGLSIQRTVDCEPLVLHYLSSKRKYGKSGAPATGLTNPRLREWRSVPCHARAGSRTASG
eukprot:scaffold2910_cov390-Prasinococcus_capsulatus_cf.AAC.25